MPHPQMSDNADEILARVREIALALPGAAEKVSHGRPTFFTKKVFCVYGGGPQGDSHAIRDTAMLFLLDAR